MKHEVDPNDMCGEFGKHIIKNFIGFKTDFDNEISGNSELKSIFTEDFLEVTKELSRVLAKTAENSQEPDAWSQLDTYLHLAFLSKCIMDIIQYIKEGTKIGSQEHSDRLKCIDGELALASFNVARIGQESSELGKLFPQIIVERDFAEKRALLGKFDNHSQVISSYKDYIAEKLNKIHKVIEEGLNSITAHIDNLRQKRRKQKILRTFAIGLGISAVITFATGGSAMTEVERNLEPINLAISGQSTKWRSPHFNDSMEEAKYTENLYKDRKKLLGHLQSQYIKIMNEIEIFNNTVDKRKKIFQIQLQQQQDESKKGKEKLRKEKEELEKEKEEQEKEKEERRKKRSYWKKLMEDQSKKLQLRKTEGKISTLMPTHGQLVFISILKQSQVFSDIANITERAIKPKHSKPPFTRLLHIWGLNFLTNTKKDATECIQGVTRIDTQLHKRTSEELDANTDKVSAVGQPLNDRELVVTKIFSETDPNEMKANFIIFDKKATLIRAPLETVINALTEIIHPVGSISDTKIIQSDRNLTHWVYFYSKEELETFNIDVQESPDKFNNRREVLECLKDVAMQLSTITVYCPS